MHKERCHIARKEEGTRYNYRAVKVGQRCRRRDDILLCKIGRLEEGRKLCVEEEVFVEIGDRETSWGGRDIDQGGFG